MGGKPEPTAWEASTPETTRCVAPAVIWVAAPAGPIGMAAEAAAEAEHHRGGCNSSDADDGEACANGE